MMALGGVKNKVIRRALNLGAVLCSDSYSTFTNLDDYAFLGLESSGVEDSHSVTNLEVSWGIGGCVEVLSLSVLFPLIGDSRVRRTDCYN